MAKPTRYRDPVARKGGNGNTVIHTIPVIYTGPDLGPIKDVASRKSERHQLKMFCATCGEPRTPQALENGSCRNQRACEQVLRTRGY